MLATCSVSPGMPTIIVPAVLNLSRHLERGLHDNGGCRTRDALTDSVSHCKRGADTPRYAPPDDRVPGNLAHVTAHHGSPYHKGQVMWDMTVSVGETAG